MSDVQVTVTLPPAPEGKEWYEIFYGDTGRPDYYQIGWALRPIAPAYVYPKVRREDAEKYVEWYNGSHRPFMNIVAAMREALEAKGEPEVAHGKCCLCAVRNPSTVWNPRPIVSGPQPKVTVGEPEPVCGKHHHDGWEYRHNEGAVLCSQPNCRLPLKHADHDGTHI